MSGRTNQEPIAQFIDRFLSRTALGVMLAALAQAGQLVEELVDPESTLHAIVGWISLGLGLATLAVVLPVFISFLLRRSRGETGCEPEGFIASAFRRASADAFSATFVALLIAGLLADRLLAAWTTGMVLRGVLCVSLAAFAIAFVRRAGVFDAEEEG